MTISQFYDFIEKNGIKRYVDSYADKNGFLKPRDDNRYFEKIASELKNLLSSTTDIHNRNTINEAIKIAEQLRKPPYWSEALV